MEKFPPSSVVTKNGFFAKDLNTIFLRNNLTSTVHDKTIYHEIKHRDHYPAQYKNNPILCENEADRFMIRKLIEQYMTELDLEPEEFNWTRFVQYYDLPTTTNAEMVQSEFFDYINNLV
ncbi:hypothetical protein BG261_05560 [Floricoccus tropicus]|uniref:IrrE N-terminal-like domain-containing protein n=1 Tax=Floricoccus tropicus TaxID=1859473 RepID=A0A1E8GKW8_9LACT|nr:hypothetical protein BG261_05560 [Floricoccus tropicus]